MPRKVTALSLMAQIVRCAECLLLNLQLLVALMEHMQFQGCVCNSNMTERQWYMFSVEHFIY